MKVISTLQVAKKLGLSKSSVLQKKAGTERLKTYQYPNRRGFYFNAVEVERLARELAPIERED